MTYPPWTIQTIHFSWIIPPLHHRQWCARCWHVREMCATWRERSLMVRWPRWLRHEGKHHSNSEEIWAESMMVELDICEIRGKISHMRTMVLVYWLTKLSDFVRANGGKYSIHGAHGYGNPLKYYINGGFNRKITKKEWWWIWFSVMYFWCLSRQDVQRRGFNQANFNSFGSPNLRVKLGCVVYWASTNMGMIRMITVRTYGEHDCSPGESPMETNRVPAQQLPRAQG